VKWDRDNTGSEDRKLRVKKGRGSKKTCKGWKFRGERHGSDRGRECKFE